MMTVQGGKYNVLHALQAYRPYQHNETTALRRLKFRRHRVLWSQLGSYHQRIEFRTKNSSVAM